jgi:signal transduction histidine kinase/ActR/RegA family two-component response regulator
MNFSTYLLGDILVNMGAVTKEKITKALEIQQCFIADLLIESDFNRAELISKNREKKNDEMPMLGQVLIDNGFVNRDQLEEALRIQNEHSVNLSRLSSEKLANAIKVGFIINSTTDIVTVLSLIMKYACVVTDSEGSTLMLLDEKTGELVFSVPTGPNSEELMDIRIPSGAGVAGWVAENQIPLLVPDTKKEERFYSKVDEISGIETKSLLCVPMRSNRRLIGVLEVINKKNSGQFDEKDTTLLSIFSNNAAIAIENAMLFRAMHNRIEKEKTIVQKIAESDRARSIGTLAAGIAHDFNNILGGIIGYAELACIDAQKDSRQFKNLEKLLEATGRAKELINQILTYSRQSKAEFKPVRLNLIAREVLKLLQAVIPRSIKINGDLSCRSKIMGDSTQLHQVIMNLCTNASHAVEENGGSINISLKNEVIDGISKGDGLNMVPGAYLKLTVEDTGIGMAPHIVTRIFEPFFTTKPSGKGTGMGLSMVQGIIKDHGGEIVVKSRVGEGTTFDVYLPLILEDFYSTEAKMDEKALSGKEHILYVDDEMMLLDAPKKLLNTLGYTVTVENSSHQALYRFKSNPDQYDIVITDMTMPEMTGDVLAQEMMKARPDLPVIITTGYNSRLTKEVAKRIGFKAFLMKPFQVKDIAQKIREVLDGVQ